MGHLCVVAVFLCVIPFLLFAWAQTVLSSGLGAILNATTPIWTGIAAAILIRGTRLTAGQLVGIGLGAVGVAIVIGDGPLLAEPPFLASLPAQLACLGATASYGLAYAWMQRFVNGRYSHDPVAIAAVQMTAAALTIPLSPFLAAAPIGSDWPPVLALAALGALGTGFAYVWNTRIVADWGPLAASTVTYLTPLVGVVLGVLVLAERVSWHEPVGALVIVVSVLLVQCRGLRLPRRRELAA